MEEKPTNEPNVERSSTELSQERTDLSHERTGLSQERTGLSHERTDLSLERTALSHERTLMAWIRTSVSMISFGFTIYKIFEELRSGSHARRLFTPRAFGMTMIAFGLLGLLLALIQHQIAMKRIKKDFPDMPLSISSLLATFVVLFGIALFFGALFRQ